MAFNNGAKLAMWSFEDKGGYGVANLTYRRKGKDGFINKGFKFCKIYDLAYEELKNVKIPDGGHVDIRIAKEMYDRKNADGKSFEQSPIEVDAGYNIEKGRQEFDIKIYKASVVKTVERSNTVTQVEEEKPPFKDENVTNEQPTSQNVGNGLVGLDFLNIPDGFGGAELPFK